MVGRVMNQPVEKIGKFPVFWLSEQNVDWGCRSCGQMQQKPKGERTIAFEVCVRHAEKNIDKDRKDVAIRQFLCLACAEKVLSDSLDRVRMCKAVGAEGYMMLNRI